jgi:hypothetical protein
MEPRMRKLWIKKPADRKGYSFWETEVSDDENCLREDDFKDSVCFIPLVRFSELDDKIQSLEKQLSDMSEVFNFETKMSAQRESDLEMALNVAAEALQRIADIYSSMKELNRTRSYGDWELRLIAMKALEQITKDKK